VDIEIAYTDLSELYETVTDSLRFVPSTSERADWATGNRVTGRVVWGSEPVPGSRVDLALPDWRTNPNSLVMRAVANGAGEYVFVNPPVGAYEVVPV